MERKQLMAFAGSGLLTIGVFAPIITILGFISFSLSSSTLDAVIILGLAAISGLLAYKKLYRPLWATGLIALGWIAFRFIYIQTDIGGFFGAPTSANTETSAQEAEFAKAFISIGWGWIALAAGAALIIAAAAVKEPEKMAISAGQ